jgi:hypothetical protein
LSEKIFGKKKSEPELPGSQKPVIPVSVFWERPSSFLILITLSVLSAICLTMPSLTFVLMITMIGIPIAIAILLSPPILIFYAPAYFGANFIGGWKGAFVGTALCSVLFAIPPAVVNWSQISLAYQLIKEDRDHLVRPVKPKVIAVRSQRNPTRGQTDELCDDFCLRALISGAADQFLIFHEQDSDKAVNSATQALSFRIDRRLKCPATTLRDGLGTLQISGEQLWGPNRVSAAAAMNVLIARGECLVQEPTTVGIADMVLTNAIVWRGLSVFDAGWKVGADTLRAERLQVHIREVTGFREVFRWTGVRAKLLFPVLLPGLSETSGMRFDTGFLRWETKWNIADSYYEGPDWSSFLTKTLGLDLRLAPEQTKVEARSLLEAALRQPGDLPAVAQKMFDDILMDVIHSRKVTGQDRAIFLSFLRDIRTQIPYGIGNIVGFADKTDIAWLTETAASAFARLRAMPLGAGGHADKKYHEQILGISSVIAAIPPDIMRLHKADLEWLAEQYPMRISAFRALVQVGALGTEGIPTLFSLLDAAAAAKSRPGKPHPYAEYDWQHNYLAGVLGLCKGGMSMSTALPAFVTRLKSGGIATNGSYWKLAMGTLVALGADDPLIESLLRATSPFTRPEHFDVALKNARQRPDCSY